MNMKRVFAGVFVIVLCLAMLWQINHLSRFTDTSPPSEASTISQENNALRPSSVPELLYISQTIDKNILTKNGSPLIIVDKTGYNYGRDAPRLVWNDENEYYASAQLFRYILDFDAFTMGQHKLFGVQPVTHSAYFTSAEDIVFLALPCEGNMATVYCIPAYTIIPKGFYKDDISKYFLREQELEYSKPNEDAYSIREIMGLFGKSVYVYKDELIFISEGNELNHREIAYYNTLIAEEEKRLGFR